MPTPNTTKEIILMDSPEPIRVLRPGQVEEPIQWSKSPYKLGLTWPLIPLHVLDHFYQQLAVCPASELNRSFILCICQLLLRFHMNRKAVTMNMLLHRNWVSTLSPYPATISGKRLLEHMGPQCSQQVTPTYICSALVGMLISTENKICTPR